MNEQIDIIIPVYNKEMTIKRCIDSILKQTYTNFRIIIVDDGSTDKSVKICEQYKDERIKVICQENAGVSGARNTALSYLHGDKLVFVDADDFVSPSYLRELLDYAQYDMVVQGYNICLEDGSVCGVMLPENREVKQHEFPNVIFDIKFYRFLTMPWNKLFDINIIKKNGIKFRNINLGEDVCFVFDYIQHAKEIIFTNSADYNYVQSAGSLTRSDIPDVWERQKDINNYCRKNFYPLYEKTWTSMYMRAAKRTLGEAASDKLKFKKQIFKIKSDCEWNEVKWFKVYGTINKLIYLLIKTNSITMLQLLFKLT